MHRDFSYFVDAINALVENSPDLAWATDVCTAYQPMGSSPFAYGTGRYVSKYTF